MPQGTITLFLKVIFAAEDMRPPFALTNQLEMVKGTDMTFPQVAWLFVSTCILWSNIAVHVNTGLSAVTAPFVLASHGS